MSNVKEILKEIAEANALSQRMDGKMSLDEAEMYINDFANENDLYELEEDELFEYVYLDKKYTGLKVDCYADDGGSFKMRGHELYFLAMNGYDKTNDMILITVIGNIHVVNGQKINISDKDLNEVINFVKRNQGLIIALANDQISNTDFWEEIRIKPLRMAESKDKLLNEMSVLKKSESNLPMDIWIDEGGSFMRSNHSGSSRIKFQSAQGQKRSSDFSSMLIPSMEIRNLPDNTYLSSKDIKHLERFVSLFMEAIMAVTYSKIPFVYFKTIIMEGKKLPEKDIPTYVKNMLEKFYKEETLY